MGRALPQSRCSMPVGGKAPAQHPPLPTLTALAQLGGDLGALEAADFNLSSRFWCWNHTYLGSCPPGL